MHTRPPKKIRTSISKRPFWPLVLCFLIPLPFTANPNYLILAGACFLSLLALLWVLNPKNDPFDNPAFPGLLVWVLCLKGVGFSLLATPGLPTLEPVSLACLFVYVILLLIVPLKAANRVQRIEQEYYVYSQPSKTVYLTRDLRQGSITKRQAKSRLNQYVEEGLYYKRLTRVANLLIHEAVGVLLVFLLLGLKNPYMLLLSLASSLAVSLTLNRICAKT